METQPKSRIESFKNLAFTASFIISTGILLVSFYNTRETDRINHRLNIREAYFNKGLIDGAKDREKAYFVMKSNYEQILLHCEKAKCDLPLNLRTLPEERQFESLESILTKNKE